MSRTSIIGHEFVAIIPDRLDEGALYICIPYTTVVHLCCCGCRSEVVTPLSPTDWSLTFNGESVTLSPSIGNWSFPCRSHYWIWDNQIRWARQWTPDQITQGRYRDARAKEALYGPEHAELVPPTTASSNDASSWFGRVVLRLRRLGR